MKIEERAGNYCEQFNNSSLAFNGYIQGATDQKKIDIHKLKDIMNRLMLDTKDKAEIIKAMEE